MRDRRRCGPRRFPAPGAPQRSSVSRPGVKDRARVFDKPADRIQGGVGKVTLSVPVPGWIRKRHPLEGVEQAQPPLPVCGDAGKHEGGASTIDTTLPDLAAKAHSLAGEAVEIQHLLASTRVCARMRAYVRPNPSGSSHGL